MIETINSVNREIAKKKGIPEETVKAINSFYWKSIKKTINSAEHPAIWIRGIGTLVASRNKLRIKITRLIRQIRKYQNPEKVFKQKSREQCISEIKSELSTLLKRRNDIAILYKRNLDKIKIKKDAKSKTSMGEQSTHSSWFD